MRAYAKAIVGALTAGVGSLAVAATESGISLSEWLTSLATALAAFGAVYGVPNREDTQTPLP